VRDPLEQVDVKVVRPGIWAAAFALLAIVYALAFPRQVAIVATVLTLPVIIFLHELAHFVTAKRTGMKVTEFFVGFGPRIWSFRRGETEYGLKGIPLGGYCKIVGMTNLEEVDPADEERTYRAKGFLAKLVVAGAGSAMHFLLAVLLMFTVLAVTGKNYLDRSVGTTIGFVEEGSPAEQAGLRTGDTLRAIDGVAVEEWQQATEMIRSREAGDVVPFAVERDGRSVTLDVRVQVLETEGGDRVRAGIAPAFDIPSVGVADALVEAPAETVEIGMRSLEALGSMFSPSGIANYLGLLSGDEEADESQRFVSPVGYVGVAADAVAAGWVEVFGLLIAINVFVGLFNLVPLLPFDGGHIAIATYERIASALRRRPVRVDVAKLLPVTAAVVAVLGFIFLSSVFLDLSNPIETPY
jgi:membrane-associated protease RseP (regulator of RpoE activity)